MEQEQESYDDETDFGNIPRFETRGGEWRVFVMPRTAFVKRVRVTTEPPTRFGFAVFQREITAAGLEELAGNPLDFDRPFGSALDQHGIVDGWGRKGDAAGYSPGQESAGDPLTGELLDLQGFTTDGPGWLWVAVRPEDDCAVSGELTPGMIGWVPNSPKEGSRARAFRVQDDVWQAADIAAKAAGETVSDILRRALRDYAADPEKWAAEHAPDKED